MSIGCRIYSLKGSLPAHINSISISPVTNESSEFSVADMLGDAITHKMLEENVLTLTGQQEADSQLNIVITSVKDSPLSFSIESGADYEQVQEWKLTIVAKVTWSDLTRDENLFEKQISAWGAYGTGVDISSDGIDNDGDNLVDEEDSDEYGSPRESAIRIATEKISELIVNNITATW